MFCSALSGAPNFCIWVARKCSLQETVANLLCRGDGNETGNIVKACRLGNISDNFKGGLSSHGVNGKQRVQHHAQRLSPSRERQMVFVKE